MLTDDYEKKIKDAEIPLHKITDSLTRIVKILKPIHGYGVGDIIRIAVNSKGVPFSQIWRRRFTDSKIDHCIEIMIEHNAQAKKAIETQKAITKDNKEIDNNG